MAQARKIRKAVVKIHINHHTFINGLVDKAIPHLPPVVPLTAGFIIASVTTWLFMDGIRSSPEAWSLSCLVLPGCSLKLGWHLLSGAALILFLFCICLTGHLYHIWYQEECIFDFLCCLRKTNESFTRKFYWILYASVACVLLVAFAGLTKLGLVAEQQIKEELGPELEHLINYSYVKETTNASATEENLDDIYTIPGSDFNNIMQKFNCCGANGKDDFVDTAIQKWYHIKVPHFCCATQPQDVAQGQMTPLYIRRCQDLEPGFVKDTGCLQPLQDWLNNKATQLTICSLVYLFTTSLFIIAVNGAYICHSMFRTSTEDAEKNEVECDPEVSPPVDGF